VKNLLAVTLLSVGLPMILMGDEVRRTQNGNNNDYCHDDESNWLDWTLLKKHSDVHRFVKLLCARRVLRSTQHERARITLDQLIQRANKSWHGVKLNQPDWGDSSHSVAFTAELRDEGLLTHFMFNAFWEPLVFDLPRRTDGSEHPWFRWIDTGLASPSDIVPWEHAPALTGATYCLQPSTLAVLLGSAPTSWRGSP
jgi:glycogen operon protein